MGDGTETPDLYDIMFALRVLTKRVASIEHLLTAEPQSTFHPRKSPDERVEEEVNCILFAMQRLEAAIDSGGSFHPVKGPACVENITRRLRAASRHVAPELAAAE